MAAVDFYAGQFAIQALSGSGLGFYGETFGASVNVSEWQQTTYITNGAGTAQGPQVNNIQFLNSQSGVVNSATSGIGLININNYLATLNIRFTHSSSVQVQNAKVRIYDRSNINNPASGVTTKVAELINTAVSQLVAGSGDTTWTSITSANGGSGTLVSLANSPGMSGLYAGNGSNSVRPDTRHDFFLAISQSPDSIGSKTLNGLYFSCEYL